MDKDERDNLFKSFYEDVEGAPDFYSENKISSQKKPEPEPEIEDEEILDAEVVEKDSDPESPEQLELPLVWNDVRIAVIVKIGENTYELAAFPTEEEARKCLDTLGRMVFETKSVKDVHKIDGNWHGTVKEQPYGNSNRWVMWSGYLSTTDD